MDPLPQVLAILRDPNRQPAENVVLGVTLLRDIAAANPTFAGSCRGFFESDLYARAAEHPEGLAAGVRQAINDGAEAFAQLIAQASQAFQGEIRRIVTKGIEVIANPVAIATLPREITGHPLIVAAQHHAGGVAAAVAEMSDDEVASIGDLLAVVSTAAGS